MTYEWIAKRLRMGSRIFKVGGDRTTVQAIASSAEWTQCGRAPLIRWEKDVFENRTV